LTQGGRVGWTLRRLSILEFSSAKPLENISNGAGRQQFIKVPDDFNSARFVMRSNARETDIVGSETRHRSGSPVYRCMTM
jgi:hypothetical protein